MATSAKLRANRPLVQPTRATVNKVANKAVIKAENRIVKDLSRTNFVRDATAMPKRKVVVGEGGKPFLVQPIPHCAANYAMGLCDPWNGQEVCLPCDLMPLPSQKNYAFCRTDMVIGTDGIGFALVKPSAASDLACVATTKVNSAGDLTTPLQGFTNTLSSYQSNNPFTTAAFMDGVVSARFTAYGISIQYDGKLMDRNGVVYCFEEPDNQSIESWTPNEIFSANFAKQSAVSEKKFTVCHSGPTDPSDLEFQSGTAGTLPRGLDYTMGIIVSGLPGDKYIVNAVFRCEYIGNSVSGKTMTHPAGSVFGSVVAAAKDVVLKNGPLKPSDSPSMWDTVKNFVRENAPFLASAGTALAKGAAAIAMRNPALGMSALGDLGAAVMGNSGPTGNVKLSETQKMVMKTNSSVHGGGKPKTPHVRADPYFLYDDPYLYQFYDLRLMVAVTDDNPVGMWIVPLIDPAKVTNINRLELYEVEGDSTWWRAWNQKVWQYCVEGLTTQSGTTPFAVSPHEFELNISIKEGLEDDFQDWIDEFLKQTPPEGKTRKDLVKAREIEKQSVRQHQVKNNRCRMSCIEDVWANENRSKTVYTETLLDPLYDTPQPPKTQLVSTIRESLTDSKDEKPEIMLDERGWDKFTLRELTALLKEKDIDFKNPVPQLAEKSKPTPDSFISKPILVWDNFDEYPMLRAKYGRVPRQMGLDANRRCVRIFPVFEEYEMLIAKYGTDSTKDSNGSASGA